MKDYQYTLESSRIVPVDQVGYYEVARLVIPRDPAYTVNLLWQHVSINQGSLRTFIPEWWQFNKGGEQFAKLRWMLRSQQTKRQGAGNWIIPPNVQDIPPKAYGGWPDREIITDPWAGTSLGWDMLIRGPAVLSLIAYFYDGDIPEDTRVGGRLRAIAYPREVGRGLSVEQG